MRRGIIGGALLSLGIHLTVASMLLALPNELSSAHTPQPYWVDMTPLGDADGTVGAALRGTSPNDHERLSPGGARSAQNIDSRHLGQGGDATGDPHAVLLLPADEGIVLFDSVLNNVDAAQAQRIRTAHDRATREQRRATPNPADEVFLASGQGSHQERRTVSSRDATHGARSAPVASLSGALPSTEERGWRDTDARVHDASDRPNRSSAPSPSSGSSTERGTDAPSPGVGIIGGRGSRASERANVAFARPSIDRGPAATPAIERDARVRDNRNSENLASSYIGSWVASTTRSGPDPGDGRGGVGGGGTAGVGGGQRTGGRASTHGPGDGRFDALDTNDERYLRWFMVNRRRIERALVFPRRRALEMDQGVAIYDLVVRRDGSLARPPRLVQPSGYADMDAAALAAIVVATPFTPVPDALAPRLRRIPVRLPVRFDNPMFR